MASLLRRMKPLAAPFRRLLARSASTLRPFDASKLTTVLTENSKIDERPPDEKLQFGRTMSDHMLEADFDITEGWTDPVIKPLENLSLHPAAMVLHYALECFEGMKAYIDADGGLRLFRPEMNMARLNRSSKRLYLPEFSEEDLLKCIKELLKVDRKWIPKKEGFSMYIRPTIISTTPWLGVGLPTNSKLYVILSPVGPYYPTGFAPVKLLADPKYIRAWPGGTGNVKCGGNYAMSIAPFMEAVKQGFAQVLWLFGDNMEVTEVGTMNQFFLWENKEGERELITAPLDDGTILPGVTRDSVLSLCREWNEFKVTERKYTICELISAVEEGRMIESFGSGTAAIVSPVNGFHFQGKDYTVPLDRENPEATVGKLTQRLADTIMGIQYGRIPHKWSVLVE